MRGRVVAVGRYRPAWTFADFHGHITTSAPPASGLGRDDARNGAGGHGRAHPARLSDGGAARGRIHGRSGPAERGHDLEHRPAAGADQARLADHPREQVLRRDLHRAEPEQLPVEDAAEPGGAAQELLRHRPLEHGQLPRHGLGPGAPEDTQERLQRRGHDFCCNADIVTTGGSLRNTELRPAASRQRAQPRGQRAERRERLHLPDATCRRCSTSSTPPGRPGRATPRICATSPAARMRRGGPGGRRTTRPPTRPS